MLSLKEKTSVAGESLLVNIGVIKPRPFSMRQGHDRSESELKTLAESIAQHGILQPLVVRHLLDDMEGYEYELVAGERRYLAASMAEFEEIPVTVCELNEREAFMVSLVENLQRENLNPIEETEGILKLLSLHLELDTEQVKSLLYKIYNCRGGKVSDEAVDRSQLAIVDQLFDQLGCFTLNNFVQRRLSLLNLSPELKSAIALGLSYTKAKELNRVSDDQQRQDLLQQVQDEDLSFREIKKLVKDALKDCDEGDDGDRVSNSQGDGDEQVFDSQGDGDEQLLDPQGNGDGQVIDSQSDGDEQVFDSQGDDSQVWDSQDVKSDRVSDSQGDIDSEVSDGQGIKSDRVSFEQDDVSVLVTSSDDELSFQVDNGDDKYDELSSQISDSQGETLSDEAIDRVIDVVNELETLAYEVIAPKLESDNQEKFLYLLEELKQLVESSS